MAEQIFIWFFLLTFACGALFTFTLIEDLFRQWRTDRKKNDTTPLPPTKPQASLPPTKETPPAIRGYDNPELFREDALVRIKRLEAEIQEDLRRMKDRG